ncbi:helicase SRCAP-like [Motacilla alba alba]|uniref:helicase SRCAP-like n=3 Tax=Passeriformes TaxID=9126 RepID=UPI0018D5A258|nr:helicase SRCAP-like [Motacilla alba alba]
MEELLQRYRGAFADSDCDSAPGASSTRSDSPGGDSEDEEDEDEEEEEDDDDDEADDEDEEEEGEGQEGGGGAPGEPGEGGGAAPPAPAQVSPAPAAPTGGPAPKKEISDIAAAAESLQPKGYTLATTQVKTPIPHLLRGTLREYQHIGLDWLVTMYEKKLNGILADEMGLGKTIQTISLLAHLACEKGSWGPHLIIVPTSVMLNWEMELKRWCPSFKILTYYGAQKERRLKRQGWTKPNAFHVCITSYKLVLQDHQAFRRKNWKYLILDEAQNIKNFKSQRWQSLLNFNSQRRLLLTGTPLQNSLMELWSLMHFLMPSVFQSHREFREWFHNPLTGMIEGSQEYNESLVKRLHKVLRPFLLRRLKVDVEKQMPKKYEHVLRCRLSKRQRFLYDDFMGQASTKATLASGHFMSVINVLMQLRKVCNHPDLFEPRPVTSPLVTPGLSLRAPALVLRALEPHPFQVDLSPFELVALETHLSLGAGSDLSDTTGWGVSPRGAGYLCVTCVSPVSPVSPVRHHGLGRVPPRRGLPVCHLCVTCVTCQTPRAGACPPAARVTCVSPVSPVSPVRHHGLGRVPPRRGLPVCHLCVTCVTCVTCQTPRAGACPPAARVTCVSPVCHLCHLCHLSDTTGWGVSPRGAGYLFGSDVVAQFNAANEVSMICRAHQLVMEGYKWHFGETVLTVWSAPNYCYRCGNVAAILELDEHLQKEFIIFEAAPQETRGIPAKKPVADYFL